MNLNRRQRSRSETRGAEQAQQHLMRFKLPHQQQHQQQPHGAGTGGRRKTSAELVSEAKSLLNGTSNASAHTASGSGGGVGLAGLRLVSTRRPVTPREAGRALYGNVTLAGRPPSAFSMRYLQNETQRAMPKTPNLAPIYSTEQLETTNAAAAAAAANTRTTTTTSTHPMKRHARRSHSLGSTVEFCKAFGSGVLHHSFDANCNNYNNSNNNNSSSSNHNSHHNHNGRNLLAMPRKLPALEIAGLPLNVQGQNTAATSNSQGNNNKLQQQRQQQQQQQDEPDDNDDGIGLNLLSSRRLLKRNCDVLSQSSTQKLIELLKEHTGLRDCTDETANHVHAILAELYGRVRKQEKRCKRGFILGGLYGLVEATSPKILLAVAKVVLALRVTGSNLTGACKLIYKVARSEQNDNLFHDNDVLELLVEGLGRASPLDDPEACIYGYGAIRFLTSSSAQERDNLTAGTAAATASATVAPYDAHKPKPATAPAAAVGCGNGNGDTSNLLQQRQQRWQRLCKQNTLVQRMARHGAVQLMVLHLQLLNEAGATRKLSGPPLHSLYQLAAALRALADVRQTSAAATAADTAASTAATMAPDGLQLQLACAHLVRAAEISIGELEVQANIVRTLSVLSEDEDCCLALVSATGRIGMLLGPCCELFDSSAAGDNKPLSVLSRFGYILGNLMAKYDQARVQFFRNDVAMEFLLDALRLCCSKPLTLRSALGDSVLDVLVKLIRVVANMSVNPEVGCGLGNVRDLGALLIGLLHTINARQRNERVKSSRSEMQELTHATLGALHNLCFYQDDDDEDDRRARPSDNDKSRNGNGNEQQQSVATALPTGCLQSVLPQLANALYATLRNAPHDNNNHNNSRNDDDDDDEYDTVQMEAVRVLGNLTRNALARQHFCRCGGISLMLQRLAYYNNSNNNNQNHNNRNDSSNRDDDEMETRACAIGVLVNLLGDEANRAPFMRLNGMEHLLHALNGVLRQRDWRFAAIICQAFWNLLTTISTTTAAAPTARTAATTAATTTIVANRIECGTELLDELCDQLADHLDEESLFVQRNASAHALWEDFAIVAADLLERIQQSLDDDDSDGDHQHNAAQRAHNYHNHNNNNRNTNDNDDDDDDDDDDEADVCMENL